MNELEMRYRLQHARSTSRRVRFTFKPESMFKIRALLGMATTGSVSISSADIARLRAILAAHSWGNDSRAFEVELTSIFNVEQFVRELLDACENMVAI